MANVRVAVRARPLNRRELDNGAKIVVDVNGETLNVTNLKVPENQECDSRERVRQFVYDYCYSSVEPRNASQEMIFQDLGTDVLEAVFEGYNACVLAYGQSGSGKTYTMMGHPEEMGLTPRICESLFSRIDDVTEDRISVRTDVSFIEIYNERVRDLLRSPLSRKHRYTLRVREHPKLGPYVQDLSRHMVGDFQSVQELIERGNENRSVAATQMHEHSSRSHAIFTINFTQARLDADLPSEVLSKIHLVDLAGSERACNEFNKTRLKEGANINKSLVTLGNVISALAEKSLSTWSLDSLGSSYSMSSSTGESVATSPQSSPRRSRQSFVPYRDSVLTWLLKDTLGGNSKTIMIATISPASTSYSETVSTLRYAQRAKCIVNRPMINEDPNVKLIRELRAEISRLRSILLTAQTNCSIPSALDGISITEILNQNENKAIALTRSWIEKWHESQNIVEDSEMSIRKSSSGVIVDSPLPHLVALNNDILSTGIQIYYLKEGSTVIGNNDPSSIADIVVSGSDIYGEHCQLYFDEGNVTLIPINGAMCMVNDEIVLGPIQLRQADILKLGTQNLFRFNNPIEALKLKKFREGMQLNRWNKTSLNLKETVCSFHHCSLHSTEIFHQNGVTKMILDSSHEGSAHLCKNCEHLRNNCINIVNAKLQSQYCDSCACLYTRRLNNSNNMMASSLDSEVDCNAPIILQKQIAENSEMSALKDVTFCKCNCFNGCHVHSTPLWNCSSHCNCVSNCIVHSSPIKNCSNDERITVAGDCSVRTVNQGCKCEGSSLQSVEEQHQRNDKPERELSEVCQENTENSSRNSKSSNSQPSVIESSCFENDKINVEDSSHVFSEDAENLTENTQNEYGENPELSTADSYCSCASNLYQNTPNRNEFISSDNFVSCEVPSFPEPVNSSVDFSEAFPCKCECELHSLHKESKYLTGEEINTYVSEKQNFRLRRSCSTPILPSTQFSFLSKDSSHLSSKAAGVAKAFQSCPDLSTVRTHEFTDKNTNESTLQLHHCCLTKSSKFHPLELPENSLRKQVIHKSGADFHQSCSSARWSGCPVMAHSLFSDSAIDICEETSNLSFRPLLSEWMENSGKSSDNSANKGNGLLEESEISEDNTQSSGFNSDLIVEVKNFVNVARDITDSEQLLKVFQNSLGFNNDSQPATEEAVTCCSIKDVGMASKESKVDAQDIPCQPLIEDQLTEICDDDAVCSDNEIIVVVENPTVADVESEQEKFFSETLFEESEIDCVDNSNKKSEEDPKIIVDLCEVNPKKQNSEIFNITENQLNIPIPQIFYSDSLGNDDAINPSSQDVSEKVEIFIQEEELGNTDMQFGVYDGNQLHLNAFAPFGSNLLSVGESDLKRSLSNLDIQQALQNECEIQNAVETDQSFCPPVSPAMAIKIRNNSWPEPSQHSLDQLDNEIKDLQEGIDENLFDEVLLNIGFEDAENGICEILYVNENQSGLLVTEKEQVLLQSTNVINPQETDVQNKLEMGDTIPENNSYNLLLFDDENLFSHSETPSTGTKLSQNPSSDPSDKLKSQEICSLPAMAATAVASSRVMRKLVRQRAKQRMSRDAELLSPSEECCSFSDDSLSEEKPSKFQSKKKRSKLNVVIYKDGYEESEYSQSEEEEEEEGLNQCENKAIENNLDTNVDEASLEECNVKRLRRLDKVISSSLSSIESACDHPNDNEALKSPFYDEIVEENENCEQYTSNDIVAEINTENHQIKKDNQPRKENTGSTLNTKASEEANNCISKTITFDQELTALEEEAKTSSVPLIVLTRPSISSCCDSFEDDQIPNENNDYDFDNIFANNILREQESHPDGIVELKTSASEQFAEHVNIGESNKSDPIDIPSNLEIRRPNQISFNQLPEKFERGDEIDSSNSFGTDDADFNSWQIDENFNDFMACKDFDRSQLKLDVDCISSSDNVSPQSTTTSSSEPSHEDYYIDNSFPILSPMDMLIDYRLISPTGRRILYTIPELSSECSSTPSESNLACSLEESLDTVELNNLITIEKVDVNKTDQLLTKDQVVALSDVTEKNPFGICPTIGSNESTKEIIDQKINSVSPVTHGTSLLSSTQDFKSRSSNESTEVFQIKANGEISNSQSQSLQDSNEMSSNLHVSNSNGVNGESEKDMECKHQLSSGSNEEAQFSDSRSAGGDRCCSSSASLHLSDSQLTGESNTNTVKSNAAQQNTNLQDHKTGETKELMSPIERVACQDLWKLREKFSQESEEETEEEVEAAVSQSLESQSQCDAAADSKTILNGRQLPVGSVVNDITNVELSHHETTQDITEGKDGDHINQNHVNVNSELKSPLPFDCDKSNSDFLTKSYIDAETLFEKESSNIIDIDNSSKEKADSAKQKVKQLSNLDYLVQNEETVHQSEGSNLIHLDSSDFNFDMDFNRKERPELVENFGKEEINNEHDRNLSKNLSSVTETVDSSNALNMDATEANINLQEVSCEPNLTAQFGKMEKMNDVSDENLCINTFKELDLISMHCDSVKNRSRDVQEPLRMQTEAIEKFEPLTNGCHCTPLVNSGILSVSEDATVSQTSISKWNESKFCTNVKDVDNLSSSIDSDTNNGENLNTLELKFLSDSEISESLSEKQCIPNGTSVKRSSQSEVTISNDIGGKMDTLRQCETFEQSIKAVVNKQSDILKAESVDEEFHAVNTVSFTQISDNNKQNKSKTELEMNSATILQKTENIFTEQVDSDHISHNAAVSESLTKNSKLSNCEIKKTSELVIGNTDKRKLLDDRNEEVDCVTEELLSDNVVDSLEDNDLVLSNAIDKSDYNNTVHDNTISKNEPSVTVINNEPKDSFPEQNATTEVLSLNYQPLFQKVINEKKETQSTGYDVVQEETAEDFSFDDIIFTLPKTLADMNYEESTCIEEPVFSNQFSEDYFKSLWQVEEQTVCEDLNSKNSKNLNDLVRKNYIKMDDSDSSIKDITQREENGTFRIADVCLSAETKNETTLFSFSSKGTSTPKDDCLSEKSDNCLFSEENVSIDIGSSKNAKVNSEVKEFSGNTSTQNLITEDDIDGDSDWISKINDAFNINLVLLDNNENSGNEKTRISDEGFSNQIDDTEILKTLSGLSINEIANEDSQSFQTQISAEKYLCSNSETNIYLKENSRSTKLRTEGFYNICSSSEGTHDRTITPDSLEVLYKDEYSTKQVTNFTTWKSRPNTNHHFTVRSTPVETSTGYSSDRAEPCSVIVPDLWDRSWETSNDSITFVFVGPGEKLHYDSNSDLLLPANFSLHKDCSGKGNGSTNLKFCRHLHPQCSLLARSVSLENINLPQHFNMIQCNLATRASSMESMIPSDLMDVVEKGRLHDIDLDEISGNHSSSSSFCADSINTVVKCDTDLLNEVEFVKKSNSNENYHEFNCRQKKSVSWSDLSGLALEQGPTSKTSRPMFLKPIIKKSENIPKSILECSASTTPLMDTTEAFKAFESKLSTPEEDLERSALFQKIKRHHTGFFTTSKPSVNLNLPDSIKARMKRSCSEADISVENLSSFESEASDVLIDDSANKGSHLTLNLPTHIKARLQKDKQEFGNFIETPLSEPETKSNSSRLCSEDEDDTLEVLDNLSLEAYHQDPLVNTSNTNIFTDNTNNNNNTSNNESNLSSVQSRLSQSLGTLMNKDSILADWARLSSVMLEASNFFQHLSIYCASKISEKTAICNEKDDFSIVNFLEQIRPQSEELSSLIQSKIVPEPITLKDVGIQCEAAEVLSSECSTQTPTELFEKNRAEAGTSTDSLISFNDKECQTSLVHVDFSVGADLEDPLNSKMTETSVNFQSKDDLTTSSLFFESNHQPNISNVSKHLIDRKVHGLQTELETTKTKKNYLNCSQIFATSPKYTETDLVNKAANGKTSKEIISSNYSFTENDKASGSNEFHLIGGDIKLAIDSTAQVNTLHLQNHRLESNQNLREACLRKELEILTGERNHVLKLLNKYGQSPQIRKDLHCNETNEFLNEDCIVKSDCDSQNLFYLMEYQARLQDACKRIEIKLEKLIKKRRVTEFVLQNGHSTPDSDLLQLSSSFTDLSQSSPLSPFPVTKPSHSQGYSSNHCLNQRLKPREYRARLVDIRRNLVAACRGSAISSQGSSNESNKSWESSPVHSNKSAESSQDKFDDLPFSVSKCFSDDETISSGNTTVNKTRKNGKFQSKQFRNFQCPSDNSPEDIRKLLQECQEARERARREIELAQEQLKHQKLAVQNLADVLRKRS